MIFVDTNVLMYAVGRSHPLREEARRFFEESLGAGTPRLVTSAEVLQELLHAYLPVGRTATLDAALSLAKSCIDEIWDVTPDDVFLARDLAATQDALRARDLLHLACCHRHGVERVKTYDRTLASAFSA